MKKQNKKGFTLVELLVVIAILAVLATVSVVGYTSFITKANNSNALTELKQAEEVILAEVIDKKEGEPVTAGSINFSYDSTKGKVKFKCSGSGEVTSDITGKFEDCKQLGGSFHMYDSKTIVYVTKNGKGCAYWESENLPIAGKPDQSYEIPTVAGTSTEGTEE